ncbi:MAG: DUF5682 family protein [Janthinobacterium lividum]
MDAAADRASLDAYGRRLVEGAGGLVFFPIRHHSPACALHLARGLAELRPRAVLVEMPADFTPLLPLILDPATRAPIAVVAVAEQPGERPSVLGYWPLSATAPEFVALRMAAGQGARLVLGDLPTTARLARRATEPEPVILTDEQPLAYSDYARGLVARVGARDFNEAWDRLFEARAAETDWRGFFRDVGIHCLLSRRTATADAMAADGTLAREAFMRTALADAVETPGVGPVAVVTGGFHTPALLDAAAEPPVPATAPSKTYLVRYGHANLDRINGYGAGMPSPRYYERLHDTVLAGQADPFASVATDVLLGLGERLRREDPGFAPPFPTLVTAVAQARDLAELRGLAGPGRSEILDAARSCFLKGEDPRFGSPLMDMLHRELTGEAIGDVPRGAGSPPLVEMVRVRGRALGFKVEDGQERRRELDIHRNARHRAASRFLHAMSLLETGFARRIQGPDWGNRVGTGVLFEVWTYAWSPLVEGRLVTLSVDGDTIERVATSLLMQRAAALGEAGNGRDAEAASRLLLAGAQAGVAAAQGPLLALLVDAVAADPEFARVVRCLGTLDGLWRGRQVLGLTGAPELQTLRAACFRRAIDLMPSLADAAPDRAGQAAAALADLHHALETSTDGTLDRALFDEGVAALLAGTLPLVVAGAVSTLAFLAARLPAADLAACICGALAGAAADPADRAAPLAGLMAVQPALLRRCEAVLTGLDDAFEHMAEEAFIAVLPHLRLALAVLDPHETDDLAERVSTLRGLAAPLTLPAGEIPEAEMLANAARALALSRLLAEDGLADWAAT